MALKVYVSYAWKAEEDSGVVAALETALAAQGVELVQDVRRVGYGESIRAFMDEIGEADQVVLVLSEAYFRSPYCLYELRAVAELRDFRRRVHPIVLAGCGLHDPLWWIDIVAHWEEQGRVLEAKLATISRANIGPLNQTVDDYADFRRLVTGQMATLADMNALTEEVHRVTDFAALVARLKSGSAIAPVSESSAPVPPPVVRPPAPDGPTPWWAEKVEHDGRGAFISVDWLGVRHRLEWDARNKLWWGTKDVGVDQYGLFGYADLGGVKQRFRWIPPGEFWMGSPEDEEGRFDNEGPRHLVRLTEGYWLAEAACSQAAWALVMGNDVSRFKDYPQSPVEQVSWYRVRDFLKEVETRLPGVKASLPTEAEWERACRAGSEAAFSWGAGINPEVANYRWSDSYLGSAVREWNKGVAPVLSFEPNSWGLYQMHGNVWEWCNDGLRLYDEAPTINSIAADRFPLSRVVRGGSRFSSPQFLRSASRLDLPSDQGREGVGFRLLLRVIKS